jgi:hypothetical protein
MYEMKLLSNKRLDNKAELKISIINKSDTIWNSGKSEGSVNLVAWISGQDKNKIKRHKIFKDFKPGDNIEYTFYLYDPFYNYLKNNQIQIDLVEEDNKWFRDKFNEIAFNKRMVELIDFLPKEFS